MEDIITILKKAREDKGMSQYESDIKAGLGRDNTYKFEKGLIRNSRIIEKIANLHGYTYINSITKIVSDEDHREA